MMAELTVTINCNVAAALRYLEEQMFVFRLLGRAPTDEEEAEILEEVARRVVMREVRRGRCE